MIHTTFAKLHEAGACQEKYKIFAQKMGGITQYGKDTPIPLSVVLGKMGLVDTLWCLRATIEPSSQLSRLFACDCAERVLPLFEKKYPNDKRPRQAIEVARKFANGQATQVELDAARVADLASALASARDAEEQWQLEHFIKLLEKEEK